MNKKEKTKNTIIFIFWLITLFLIVVLSLSNGTLSQQQSGFFSNIYLNICKFFLNRPLMEIEVSNITEIVRKGIGHMLLFIIHGLLTFMFFKSKPGISFILIIGYGFLLSTLSEVFQLIAGGRTFSLLDIALDFISFSYFPIVFYLRYRFLKA